MTLQKLLIANRGEIVVRVARTARALGLDTVAVFTEADSGSPHPRAADVAVRIGSYLDAEEIVAAAQRTGADSLHPGYGFLAENAGFACAVVEAGLVWVGPPADAIEAMGDKAAAKARMQSAGVPVVPGEVLPEDADGAALGEIAERVGFPLLIKAVAGGGGRGLRRVDSAGRLMAELETARSEAQAAFGDGRLMLERLVEGARHVEIQILADGQGHVMHLGERDCTAQRRHQKILEESPSPPLEAGASGAELRRRMCEAAVAAAREIGYVGAGTVEMLLAPESEGKEGSFYFLEMNTRLQVEHPVTELRYGLDLVAWQLRVANGQSLPSDLSQLTPRGHAIEARVYAEDPARGFAPSPATVLRFRPPKEIAGVVRVDHALADGVRIPPDYDPMLAKVVVHGRDRDDALHKLHRALGELVLFGPKTNIEFLRHVVKHAAFVGGEGFDTGWVERDLGDWSPPEPTVGTMAIAASLLSERDGAASAGNLWGWRSAAGTEGWPVKLLASDATGSTEPTEVWLTPLRPEGRDPRDVVRATVGEGWDGVEVEIDFAQRNEEGGRVRVDGLEHDVRWAFDGADLWLRTADGTHVFHRPRKGAAAEAEDDPTIVKASMTARVKEVRVAEGDVVEEGDCLLVLEAMKLETRVEARISGKVVEVLMEAGEQVAHRQVLVRLGSSA